MNPDFFKLTPEELPADFRDICPICWMPKKEAVEHNKTCECGFETEPGKIYFTTIPSPGEI